MLAMLVLYYGSEVCPRNKIVIGSLHYVIKSCFRKFFHTISDDVIAEYMDVFNCLSWPVLLILRCGGNFL